MLHFGVGTKVLLTRLPLKIVIRLLDVISNSSNYFPLDLHALSTPPAFILDQDQILYKKFLASRRWLSVKTTHGEKRKHNKHGTTKKNLDLRK